MCEPVSATIAATAAVGLIGGVIQSNAQRKAQNLQRDAMNAQVARDNEAKAKAEAIGPAARAEQVDPTQSQEEMKRRQLALQNGISGTIKSDMTSLATTPVETKKATLGA